MKDGWNIVPFLAQLFIGFPIKMRKSNEGWMEYCPLPGSSWQGLVSPPIPPQLGKDPLPLPGTAVHWISF